MRSGVIGEKKENKLSFESVPAAIAERLDALRPVIVRNAERGAAERKIPAESIGALEEAGVFKTMVPKRHGGYEGSIRTLLEVAGAVAEMDGATGWVVGLSQVSAWTAGLFSGKAQDDVFGANPDARLCGSLNPVGIGERVPGGWRVSGRWSYVSGSLHAQWAVLGVSVPEGAPAGWERCVALVPMTELTLHDTWRMAGMRGTGSNTLTCEGVFVPDHRMMSLEDAATGRSPTEFKDEAAYRAAFLPTLTVVLAGPLLGIGRAAVRHVRTAASEKGIVATTFARQADSAGFQIQLAEAALRIDSAHLHAFRAATDIDRNAAADVVPDYDARARIRADTAVAAGYVTSAVSTLLDAHGSGGFAESSPLHRIWQDANVGARHALLNAGVGYEVYGKALLGIANDISPAV
jgi:alkylation response protein AidB-like acyl-CoA dehydrogenase